MREYRIHITLDANEYMVNLVTKGRGLTVASSHWTKDGSAGWSSGGWDLIDPEGGVIDYLAGEMETINEIVEGIADEPFFDEALQGISQIIDALSVCDDDEPAAPADAK